MVHQPKFHHTIARLFLSRATVTLSCSNGCSRSCTHLKEPRTRPKHVCPARAGSSSTARGLLSAAIRLLQSNYVSSEGRPGRLQGLEGLDPPALRLVRKPPSGVAVLVLQVLMLVMLRAASLQLRVGLLLLSYGILAAFLKDPCSSARFD